MDNVKNFYFLMELNVFFFFFCISFYDIVDICIVELILCK